MAEENELRCIQCRSAMQTAVLVQVDHGGRIVRYRVDCDKCGGFSHFLKYELLRDVALSEFLSRVRNEIEAGRYAGALEMLGRKQN